MKQLNFSLGIFLFIGLTYAQAQVISQTEELDITRIEKKAKLDARTDFDISKRLTWGVGSTLSGVAAGLSGYLVFIRDLTDLEDYTLILVSTGLALVSGPFLASIIIDVNLPETRQMEVANEGERYRYVYRSKYISEIKKHRLIYSLASPVVAVATLFGLLNVIGGFGS